MPGDVEELLRRQGGVVLMADCRTAGLDRNRVERLVRGGLLVPLARGCYAATDRIAKLDVWALLREKARAFVLASGLKCYAASWAAVVVWDLRPVGRPPLLPTVIVPRLPGRGRGSTTVHGKTVLTALPDRHRVSVRSGSSGRLWGVVDQAWAAADVARLAPVPDGLVVADAAARIGADVTAAAVAMGRREGVSRARWVAEHTDPLSESALETLGRFTCIEFNLPMPVSNAWIGVDEPELRVDHLWPYHWVAGEGDGAQKYNNRSDAAIIVRSQSDREFRLRRVGLDLVRYGWPEAYYGRSGLAEKFAAVLRDNPRRDEPIRWWMDVPGRRPVQPRPEDWPSPHPLGIVLPAGWSIERDELRERLDDDLGEESHDPDLA